jgi:hypothetical protein
MVILNHCRGFRLQATETNHSVFTPVIITMLWSRMKRDGNIPRILVWAFNGSE